jgi:hypothetical protein
VEEFLARPLQERLGLILNRNVRFFARGQEVPLKEGMRILREMGARAGAAPAAAPAPAEERMALAEFLALPLEQKLRIVVDERVRLYDARGSLVPFKEALKMNGRG